MEGESRSVLSLVASQCAVHPVGFESSALRLSPSFAVKPSPGRGEERCSTPSGRASGKRTDRFRAVSPHVIGPPGFDSPRFPPRLRSAGEEEEMKGRRTAPRTRFVRIPMSGGQPTGGAKEGDLEAVPGPVGSRCAGHTVGFDSLAFRFFWRAAGRQEAMGFHGGISTWISIRSKSSSTW